LVLILLDSRRELSLNDKEMLDYCIDNNINYIIVITKADKINQSEKAKLYKHLASVGIKKENTYLTSILDKKSLINLKGAIEKII
jgi:GTP-binding protein